VAKVGSTLALVCAALDAGSSWAQSGAQAKKTGPQPVQITVNDPEVGATVRGRVDMVRVAGFAQTGGREAFFDVMLVLDVSGSTAYPSGADIDTDGVLGVRGKEPLLPGLSRVPCTDPDDSVLAAEIQSALRLLEILDPTRVRVGLVTFSGFAHPATLQHDASQPSSWVEQPLTADYDSIRRALQAVSLRGPSGGTDMQAGLKTGLAEVAGLPGSQSQARPDARRVILLLTDGKPSLPYGLINVTDQGDDDAVVEAAKLAAEADTRVNVYGLGPDAIDSDYPSAGTRVAQLTGGVYVPVRKPGDVVVALPGVSFTNIEEVVANNLTNEYVVDKRDVELRPDGSFKLFVRVQPGDNQIRLLARSSDGARGQHDLTINFTQQDLSDADLERELERVRQRSKDIEIIAERRRQEAERAAQRSREIKVDVEDDSKKKP